MKVIEKNMGRFLAVLLEGSSPSLEEKIQLDTVLTRAVTEYQAVVVDCTKLKYANSQFVTQMLTAYKMLKGKNGTFAMVCPQESYVMDILRITSIDTYIPVYNDLEAFISKNQV